MALTTTAVARVRGQAGARWIMAMQMIAKSNTADSTINASTSPAATTGEIFPANQTN